MVQVFKVFFYAIHPNTRLLDPLNPEGDSEAIHGSVLEVPRFSEDHGKAMLIRCLDDFLVSYRAAGLDNSSNA